MSQIETEIKQFSWHYAVITWASVLIINFIVLGIVYWSFQKNLLKTPASQKAANMAVELAPTPFPTAVCQSLFDAALATLAAQRQNSTQIIRTETLPSNVKEYYVPLGSVTMKSFGLWSDTGMQAYVDPKNYAGAKVYFEASMKIPTANGRVYLRLVQANENYFVPGSEISMEGNQSKLVSSGPISLASGNKLYKVQMNSTMDYEAVVEFARLKINL